jgi:PhnB protein
MTASLKTERSGVNPIPEGFHTVTPYLIAKDIEGLLKFVTDAFGSKPEVMRKPDGTVMHSAFKIGDSWVMACGAGAGEGMSPLPTMLYIYVNDVDAIYKKCIAAGGKQMMEPKDQFYGDRAGSFKDCCDNIWWIATRVEEPSESEIRQRAQDACAKS